MAPKRQRGRPTRRSERVTDDEVRERTNPTNPETSQNEQIAQIVAQQIVAAIPTIVAQLNQSRNTGNDSNEACEQGHRVNPARGSSSEEVDDTRNGCSYKTFMSCRPKDFNGNEGAVGALRCLEEMESVIDISDCTNNCKVKYVTHSLKGEALSWRNMVVLTKGRDAVNKMS